MRSESYRAHLYIECLVRLLDVSNIKTYYCHGRARLFHLHTSLPVPGAGYLSPSRPAHVRRLARSRARADAYSTCTPLLSPVIITAYH